MPVEPLAAVAVFAGLVCALCALSIAYTLGYDRGHARASANGEVWRAAGDADYRTVEIGSGGRSGDAGPHTELAAGGAGGEVVYPAEFAAWRAELAAQVKAAKASYASPPPPALRTDRPSAGPVGTLSPACGRMRGRVGEGAERREWGR